MLKRTVGVSLVTGDPVELIEEVIEPARAGEIEMQEPSRRAILRRVLFGKPTTENHHAM